MKSKVENETKKETSPFLKLPNLMRQLRVEEETDKDVRALLLHLGIFLMVFYFSFYFSLFPQKVGVGVFFYATYTFKAL